MSDPFGRGEIIRRRAPRLGDHDPTNNDPANLAALCQRCHILHDRKEHLRRRRFTYITRRALRDLFTGPYPRE